jgi:hypothetical protein
MMMRCDGGGEAGDDQVLRMLEVKFMRERCMVESGTQMGLGSHNFCQYQMLVSVTEVRALCLIVL